MLTDAQRSVYKAVVALISTKHRTPKYTEIGAKLGLRSPATVHKHIKALIRKGWLTRPSPHELEIVPVTLRNDLEWHSCAKGHARCWFQVEKCPACTCGILLKTPESFIF